MTEEIARGWDRHARTYARVAAPFTGYIAQALFHTAAGRLPPGSRILDIACGNGELSRAATLHCLAEEELAEEASRTEHRAAAHAAAPRVVAIDFSPEMVALAEKNLSVLGGEGILRCEVQDGQALTFESSSFDAVFSSFGIFLFPDRLAGWREAARVLRPGGLFATSVWRGPDHNALARLQMGPVLAALPEPVRAALPRASWFDIASPEGLEEELRSAGLRDVEISIFEAMLTVPTPRAMWESMRENPVTAALLSSLSEGELEGVARSVLESFEGLAGGKDRPLRLAASCHFAIARRR